MWRPCKQLWGPKQAEYDTCHDESGDKLPFTKGSLFLVISVPLRAAVSPRIAAQSNPIHLDQIFSSPCNLVFVYTGSGKWTATAVDPVAQENLPRHGARGRLRFPCFRIIGVQRAVGRTWSTPRVGSPREIGTPKRGQLPRGSTVWGACAEARPTPPTRTRRA